MIDDMYAISDEVCDSFDFEKTQIIIKQVENGFTVSLTNNCYAKPGKEKTKYGTYIFSTWKGVSEFIKTVKL